MAAVPLVFFVLMAVGYSLASPPFENPDEVTHAQYATFFSDYRRLPRLPTDCVRMAFHPPLYHALISPLAALSGTTTESIFSGYHVNRDATSPLVILTHGYPDEVFPYSGAVRFVHLARLASILPSLVTLLYTWKLALLLLRSRSLALLASMAVAALPQFQYISASLNHDSLAAAACSAFVFHATRLARGFPLDAAVKAGLALGVAALTKSSALALAPLVVLSALLSVRTAPLASILRRGAALCGLALAVGGFWYLQNVEMFGTPLPTVQLVQNTWVGFGLARPSPPSWSEALALARDLFRSFVFLGGLMNVAAPTWLYAAWGIILAVGLAGLVALCRTRSAVVPVAGIVLSLASLAYFNLFVVSPQGRYLFIALPVVGVAIARGFDLLAPSGARRWLLPVGIVFPPILAAVYFLVGFVPVYERIEPREREATWRGTSQLHCENEYRAGIRSPGGRIGVLELSGRRLGTGEYDVELTLFRADGTSPVAHARVHSAEIPAERGPVTFSLEPIDTQPDEPLILVLRAPKATPVARSLFFYRTVADSSALAVNGMPLDGVLSVSAKRES